jgi:hypothetical protein
MLVNRNDFSGYLALAGVSFCIKSPINAPWNFHDLMEDQSHPF